MKINKKILKIFQQYFTQTYFAFYEMSQLLENLWKMLRSASKDADLRNSKCTFYKVWVFDLITVVGFGKNGYAIHTAMHLFDA